MKAIKLFVYALIVSMSFVSVAEAKGRSGSFKSGFSSQKRPVTRPTKTYYQAQPANAQTKQTAFGSFGASNPKPDQQAVAIPQSKMSQDLNATAAQTNAMKSIDARAKTHSPTNAVNSESGWFRSGSQTTAMQKPAEVGSTTNGYQPAPQQHNSRQGNSSGILPAIAGFMIGHSLAQQHNTAGQPAPNGQGNVQAGQTPVGPAEINGISTQQLQDVPVVETESIFMKLLRLVLWLAIIGGVVWGMLKLSSMRNSKTSRAVNYSLGR